MKSASYPHFISTILAFVNNAFSLIKEKMMRKPTHEILIVETLVEITVNLHTYPALFVSHAYGYSVLFKK